MGLWECAVEELVMGFSFFKGKRVLLTGHTGFKGSWMSRILVLAGAELTGYSLEPPTGPSLFPLTGHEGRMHSAIGDVRDLPALKKCFDIASPEIVIHMAAQPIVREGYENPVYTYETNVMGTVNVMECIRRSDTVKSVVNVTTDKVYLNREWEWGYRETDVLDGYDPYSNSKSCSELVTHSYVSAFLAGKGTAVSTARAGNVIGGGDFAKDRIIPDCVRAAQAGRPIVLRNPNSTRPYQHVLESLSAYLLIARKQWEAPELADSYNVGPGDDGCATTGELSEFFCASWGKGLTWESTQETGPHEADFLKLDCSKIKSTLGWEPKWAIAQAVEKTVEWTRVYLAGGDALAVMDAQIRDYFS